MGIENPIFLNPPIPHPSPCPLSPSPGLWEPSPDRDDIPWQGDSRIPGLQSGRGADYHRELQNLDISQFLFLIVKEQLLICVYHIHVSSCGFVNVLYKEGK